jgi:hypothetical protein
MKKPRIIIDRIENGLAVCEQDGKTVDISIAKIGGSVREGDILRENDDGTGYLVAKEETEQRRADIKARFERLKERR